MTRKIWTSDDESSLRELYFAKPRSVLAAMLDRTENAVAMKARKLGLRHPTKPALSRKPRPYKVYFSPAKAAIFMEEAQRILADPRGANFADLMRRLAHRSVDNVGNMLAGCVANGLVVKVGPHRWSRYFLSQDLVAAGMALVAVDRAAARLAALDVKRAQSRARWAASRPANVDRPPSPPKHAAPAPPKKVTALKPPKPAPTVLRKAGSATATSKAVKLKGAAHLPCEPDMSRAKVTIAPTPAGRYDVPADFRGAFSTAGVGRYLQEETT